MQAGYLKGLTARGTSLQYLKKKKSSSSPGTKQGSESFSLVSDRFLPPRGHRRGLASFPPLASWFVTLGAPSAHAGSPRYWRLSNSLQELSVQRSGQDSVLAVILNAAVYTWLPRLRSRRPKSGWPLTSSASLLEPLRIFQALSVRPSLG